METRPNDWLGPLGGQSSTGIRRAVRQLQRACVQPWLQFLRAGFVADVQRRVAHGVAQGRRKSVSEKRTMVSTRAQVPPVVHETIYPLRPKLSLYFRILQRGTSSFLHPA